MQDTPCPNIIFRHSIKNSISKKKIGTLQKNNKAFFKILIKIFAEITKKYLQKRDFLLPIFPYVKEKGP